MTDSAAHCFGVVEEISVEFTESSSNQSMDPRGKIPVGYCLVSMESLVEFARRIQSNSPCSSDEMIIFFAISIVFIIRGASLLSSFLFLLLQIM